MAMVYVGIDLAKNAFAVHGVHEHGKAALVRPAVPRGKLHELIAALPPCTVAMEACSGGHHWARRFAADGHTVRLIAPKFATPYRMSGARGENDAADAAAICEAVQRPSMRFVPVKSIDVVMVVPESGFRFTRGEPTGFARSDLERPVTRYFCPRCGTALVTRSPARPGSFILKVGTLDDRSVFEPRLAIFTLDKQPFHHIPEGLPAFERRPG